MRDNKNYIKSGKALKWSAGVMVGYKLQLAEETGRVGRSKQFKYPAVWDLPFEYIKENQLSHHMMWFVFPISWYTWPPCPVI